MPTGRCLGSPSSLLKLSKFCNDPVPRDHQERGWEWRGLRQERGGWRGAP